VTKRVLLVGAAIASTMVLGLLAACGNSGGSGATSNAAPGGGASGFAAYTDCLRQHGVNLPTGRPSGQRSGRPTDRPSGVRPSGGGRGGGFGGGGFFGSEAPPGVDQNAWDSARKACASELPSFGPRASGNSAFQAYRNCLTEHGVTLSGGPGGFGGIDTADPKVAAALATCAPLRPSGRPGGPGPAAS
jgi:hypothetical protein